MGDDLSVDGQRSYTESTNALDLYGKLSFEN